jgi:methionine synthase I (cobalamin-dependent)
LLDSGPVITDGAWGSLIQSFGLPPGQCADSFNISHPDKVERVARAYVDAGSQIILTNTFRSNRLALRAAGLENNIKEINTAGVEISKRAAGHDAYVFASIGPSDKMLMLGQTSEAELAELFTEQAELLATAGADGLVLETMTDIDELKIALAAALDTALPVVACMIFDSGPDKAHTMMGVSAKIAAEQLTAAGADVIGANCGRGIADFIPVCQAMRESTEKPLWMKANAGIPEMIDGKVVYKTTVDDFALGAAALKEAGADFIGGCCGTTPDFIAAIATALRD